MMARAALSVVFDHGRDAELSALRSRIAALEAARSAERWGALCRAGVLLSRLPERFDAIRSLIAEFIVEERWCVAEGVTGPFYCPPGRLNFHYNAIRSPLHIEAYLVNLLADDLADGVWYSLSTYLNHIAGLGIYTPSENMFYQGDAPPRGVDAYNLWGLESDSSDSEGASDSEG
jgi:hypothetical protein